MSFKRHVPAVLGFALFLWSSAAEPAAAQSVSCTGVAAWSASTIYNAGDRMVYQNQLYQANIPIWNTAPSYCPSCGWYTLLGTCGTSDTTAPSVPTGLASPSQTVSSIALTWNASTDNTGGSGIAGYDVYRDGTMVGSPATTGFTATGLTSNTSYSFRVRARDNAGNTSAQGVALSVRTLAAACSTLPSVPTGLASPGQTTSSINLAWNASTPGANCTVSYRVYRGGSLVGSPAGTTFTNTGLSANTTYAYTVAAVNEFGSSAQSAPLSVKTLSATCATLPSVPTGLASPSQTTSSVSLTWNASTPGANCTLQYRVFVGGAQATQVAATSAVVGGLAANTTYSFTVGAINEYGSSAQSGALSVKTSSGGSCTAPQYLAGTAYSAGQEVQNIGELYRCNIAGWCSSSAAWAYAPGTGTYWTDAWSHVGPCGGGGNPPTVSLTAPASGASYEVGTAITISATASDSDGSVTKVEFLDNGVVIGEDATSPYSLSWSGGSQGQHQLAARATDNDRNATSSATRTITINCPAGGCGGSLPKRLLIGYWHNFDNGSGFIKLRNVSTDWDVVNVSFAEPVSGSTSQIAFVPYSGTSAAELKSDIAILHGRGKKVLVSIGGANGHVELRNATERQQFVTSMKAIITEYGFDGMDIDFEGQSVHVNPGDSDFANPTTPVITNLISAIREIRNAYGSSFVLTMAPETFFVQVGYQFYGGSSGGDSRTGAYLPVIHGVRDILTVIHVQHYNSGSVTALDNQWYAMGNADFHVAMAEMLLTGFSVANTGKFFPALRQDQVMIGLPANGNAGNGYTSEAEVQKALNYLVKGQSYGGNYVLRNPGGYPNFRGLMSWSVNWDAFNNFAFSRSHRAYLNALP